MEVADTRIVTQTVIANSRNSPTMPPVSSSGMNTATRLMRSRSCEAYLARALPFAET